ncbi:13379_t:CDS:2 [Acaulospora colombiana]|uniref:13379_t:CDS:1 n=1 Tax=Acaulospora colombiana TaxID=27376 RepID=A0ACA9N6Y8_9GLOM|nr:13379_t:CDS:2 [Acaulospora colombiana]
MATGRNRSGTLVSQLSSQLQMYPVQSKDCVNLQASIHVNGSGGYPNVLLNRDWWKDVQNGDVIELKGGPHKESCVFVLEPTDPAGLPPNIQVSISQDVAKYFELSAGTEVTLTKVGPEKYAADVVESSEYNSWAASPQSLNTFSSNSERSVQFNSQ